MSNPIKQLLNRATPAFLQFASCRKPTVIGLHNPEPKKLDAILGELSKIGEFLPYRLMAKEIAESRSLSPGFIVTFDDGYRENMDILDILDTHNCRAMFFVSTACLDSPRPLWFMNIDNAGALKGRLRRLPYKSFLEQIDRRQLTHRSNKLNRFGLTSAELREIRSRGHDIGVHTHNHVFLSSLKPDEIAAEITTCAKYLNKALGTNDLPLHVAYPDGDYDQRVITTMESLNVRTAVTTKPGSVGDSTFRLALPRVVLSDDDPPGYAAFKITKLYARLKNRQDADARITPT